MSSQYVTLGNRPLDQWKVTELKEELKKRKLTIRGLKEDLVKRLDEAVRAEQENTKLTSDDELDEDNQSELPSEQVTGSIVSGKAKDPVDSDSDITYMLDKSNEIKIDDGIRIPSPRKVMETDVVEEKNSSELDTEQVPQCTTMGTVTVCEVIEPVTALSISHTHDHVTNEDGNSTGLLGGDGVEACKDHPVPELPDPNAQLPHLEERSTTILPAGKFNLQDGEIQSEASDSMVPPENNDSNCPQSLLDDQSLKCQVPGIDDLDLESQIISDSVSTEHAAIIEKNEIQVDVITDSNKLELNVNMPEHPLNVEESLDKQLSSEEIHTSLTESAGNLKYVDSDDLDPEKLSLDRSSGDDSMEEDVLDSKQTDFKSDSIQTSDMVEKIDLDVHAEDRIVDVTGSDLPVETNIAKAENSMDAVEISVKRKHNAVVEAVGDNYVAKRARRWNVDGLKSSEPQIGTSETPQTPKDFAKDSQISMRRFNKSDSMMDEVPTDRIVPSSSKPPTNSLRIDQFLRPFTLKAVQELLGKTGAITSFWMDHIKTHCYVSYSSVEEAESTRNAVYNLQWPPNGGRMLIAEFVEPEEVKARVEPTPSTFPMPHSSGVVPNSSFTQSTTMQSQPSPRPQFPRKQLPPSLPPPPPPLNESQTYPTRESIPRDLPVGDMRNLHPLPPVHEKVDPPIVTLDDLFRKTNAIPRIYYLPLSDDQVALKCMAQREKNNV